MADAFGIEITLPRDKPEYVIPVQAIEYTLRDRPELTIVGQHTADDSWDESQYDVLLLDSSGDKLLLGTDGGYLILDPNQAFPTSGIEYTLRADSPQYTIEEE